MGTNYYVKWDVCRVCGHAPSSLHIGKHAAGEFIFHGYRNFNIGATLTVNLDSFIKWKLFLNYPKVKIEDEYGVEITLPDFITLVESGTIPDRRTIIRPTEWYDPDGYEFYDGEFC